MAGGHGNHPIGVAATHGHGGKEQTLGHGGAGSVQTQVGDAGIAQGKGRADALIQQIAGEYQIDVLGAQMRLVQELVQRQLLHFLLRLLPGFFSEFRVHAPDVKSVSQRPFGLFFSAHRRPVFQIYRLRGAEGVASKLVFCHRDPSFPH